MVIAVNNQALAGSLSAARAEEAVKDVDTGNKGNPGTEDAQAVVVRISTEGARRAEVAAQAPPSAQAQVVQPDGDGSSPVTVPQFKAAAPTAPPADSGGGAPTGGQAPAAAASTPSASQTYELADTNQDGEVSPMEETAYEAKLAAEKQAKAEANAPRAAEANAAVRTYTAVEQLRAAG